MSMQEGRHVSHVSFYADDTQLSVPFLMDGPISSHITSCLSNVFPSSHFQLSLSELSRTEGGGVYNPSPSFHSASEQHSNRSPAKLFSSCLTYLYLICTHS